ncbi:alpha/beta fold hydrolase [Pelagibacterium sp.]|uniref:alpha/beta fold hydrolase n=1 Tax=Pelagibacterium sp. TaxID=1967288 RepID=UPI003BAA909A
MDAKPAGHEFVHLETNPIPKGARSGFFSTSDNVRLRYGIFPKQGEAPRGTIVLVQGRTEFIEKYFETIGDFQKRGFTVASFDLRGQGGSDRMIGNSRHGHVENFDDYWTDLDDFHKGIVLPDCPPPYFLVGHSTGGLIGLLAATRDRLMFDRVFLSSPMVSLPGLPFSLKWSSRLVDLARFLGLSNLPVGRRGDREQTESGYEGNPLTSDKKRYMRSVEILKARPDLIVGLPTLGWIGSSLAAMRVANGDDFPARLKIPVFICAAALDSVVDTSATEALGLRLRAGHHVVLAGARHELFMEADPIREQVFAAFDAFVTEQTGYAGS